jgi:hypothetical protein
MDSRLRGNDVWVAEPHSSVLYDSRVRGGARGACQPAGSSCESPAFKLRDGDPDGQPSCPRPLEICCRTRHLLDVRSGCRTRHAEVTAEIPFDPEVRPKYKRSSHLRALEILAPCLLWYEQTSPTQQETVMNRSCPEPDDETPRPNDIEPPFRPGPVEANDDKVPTSDPFRPRPPEESRSTPRPSLEHPKDTLRGRRLVQLRVAYQRG